MNFGEWLRKKRSERDLTLLELGAATGLSHSMIQRLEQGERNPSRETVIKLAEALSASASEALFHAKMAPDDAIKYATTADEVHLLDVARKLDAPAFRALLDVADQLART